MTNRSELSCPLHAKPVASQGEHRLATLSISCAFAMLSNSFRLVRLKVSRCPGFTCWPTRRLLASPSQSQRLRAAYTRASTRTVQPLYTSKTLGPSTKDYDTTTFSWEPALCRSQGPALRELPRPSLFGPALYIRVHVVDYFADRS